MIVINAREIKDTCRLKTESAGEGGVRNLTSV